MVGFNVAIYAIMLMLLWPYYNQYEYKTNNNAYIAIVLFSLFCMFSFWGTDYFHYMARFRWLSKGYIDRSIEEVYTDIAIRSSTYTIFRMIIWGGAIVFCIFIAKNLRISLGLFFLILIGGFITKFSYGRVTLAMSLIFMGVSLIVRENNSKFIYKVIGLVCLFLSFYFHKSAPFGIIMAFLSLFLANIMTRKFMNIFLIVYPFLLIILNIIVIHILSINQGVDNAININAAQSYLTAKNGTSLGIGAILGNILTWGGYYLTAFVYLKSIYSYQYNEMTVPMKVFGTAAFLIVSTATLFAFDLGANTYVYFYRFLFFAMIPCTVFLCYCIIYELFPRLVKNTVKVCIIGTSYQLLYSLYLAFIGAHKF